MPSILTRVEELMFTINDMDAEGLIRLYNKCQEAREKGTEVTLLWGFPFKDDVDEVVETKTGQVDDVDITFGHHHQPFMVVVTMRTFPDTVVQLRRY